MVITDRQRRAYAVLIIAVVIVMLAVQYWLKGVFEDICFEYSNLTAEDLAAKNRVAAQHDLLVRYRALESATHERGGVQRVFPDAALDLFAAVESALTENSVDHSNMTSASSSQPGGPLQINISFSGPYYSVMKSLASMKRSHRLMKISQLHIEAAPDGMVKGTMSVASVARPDGAK